MLVTSKQLVEALKAAMQKKSVKRAIKKSFGAHGILFTTATEEGKRVLAEVAKGLKHRPLCSMQQLANFLDQVTAAMDVHMEPNNLLREAMLLRTAWMQARLQHHGRVFLGYIETPSSTNTEDNDLIARLQEATEEVMRLRYGSGVMPPTSNDGASITSGRQLPKPPPVPQGAYGTQVQGALETRTQELVAYVVGGARGTQEHEGAYRTPEATGEQEQGAYGTPEATRETPEATGGTPEAMHIGTQEQGACGTPPELQMSWLPLPLAATGLPLEPWTATVDQLHKEADQDQEAEDKPVEEPAPAEEANAELKPEEEPAPVEEANAEPKPEEEPAPVEEANAEPEAAAEVPAEERKDLAACNAKGYQTFSAVWRSSALIQALPPSCQWPAIRALWAERQNLTRKAMRLLNETYLKAKQPEVHALREGESCTSRLVDLAEAVRAEGTNF